MTIAEMLEVEMEKSNEYARRNYGAQVSADFPQTARGILESDKVAGTLAAEFVLQAFQVSHLVKALDQFQRPADLARNEPIVSTQALKYLYWGIQIGRQFEGQQP